MNSRILLFAAALLASACSEERPQWRVFVSTDAPLPQFGDHVLVEVFRREDSKALPSASRDFAWDDTIQWPVSFGIERPADGGTFGLRLRLYRASYAYLDGTLNEATTLDFMGELPVATTGIVDVGAHLTMDCFGHPSDLDNFTTCLGSERLLAPAPILRAPIDRGPNGGLGTWPPAQHKPCSMPAPEGMACVPGGAFLLGDAKIVDPSGGGNFAGRLQPSPEVLVRLDPFALDIDEVTVGQFAAVAPSLPVGLGLPAAHDESDSTKKFCTWPSSAKAGDPDVPLNCVSYLLAGAYCAHFGKRLPREAEWEFAAGNGPSETRWPWGYDCATASGVDIACVCARTVIEHAPSFGDGDVPIFERYSACNENKYSPGAVAGGTSGDVTFSPAEIRNLAGNLAEWVADSFEPYGSGGCWSMGKLVENPCCGCGSGISGTRSVRGASWADSFTRATVAVRREVTGSDEVANPLIGFRCAKSM